MVPTSRENELDPNTQLEKQTFTRLAIAAPQFLRTGPSRQGEACSSCMSSTVRTILPFTFGAGSTRPQAKGQPANVGTLALTRGAHAGIYYTMYK